MTIRDDIVAEARSWVGTPFRHQGRRKGKAVDCAGVVIETGKELDLLDYKEEGYATQPDPTRMGALLERYLDPIDRGDLKPGDILWMRFIEPMHLAIFSRLQDGRDGVIHAYSNVGRCVEHGLDDKWLRRVHRCYRYRGVE